MIGVGYAGPVLSGAEVSECQQISDLRKVASLHIATIDSALRFPKYFGTSTKILAWPPG